MPVINKSVTVLGASTVVDSIHIYPRAGGASSVTVNGHTLDSLGNSVPLADFSINLTAGQFPPADQMIAAALAQLRIANGLET